MTCFVSAGSYGLVSFAHTIPIKIINNQVYIPRVVREEKSADVHITEVFEICLGMPLFLPQWHSF